MRPGAMNVSGLREQLAGESDRGAALLCANFVNEALKRRLAQHFGDSKPGRELLDDANAPLAGLSAAAKACHALGLVDDAQYRDLLQLRQLRNEFAHAWEPRSFDDPGMRRSLGSLAQPGKQARAAFIDATCRLLAELGVPD